MKKRIYFVFLLTLVLFAFTGCANQGVNMENEESKAAKEYLTGEQTEDYLVTEDTILDLTDVIVNEDKTIIVKDATLSLSGEYSIGSGCITVRSEGENASLDMSQLLIKVDSQPDMTLFEISSTVSLIEPQKTNSLVIEQGSEWISIRIVEEVLPGIEDGVVNTPEEFLQLLNDDSVSYFEIATDLTVDLSGVTISDECRVDCRNNSLTLTGNLCIQDGGNFIIGVAPDCTGTLDLSGLSVTTEGIDVSQMSEGNIDLINVMMNFKQVTGEPTLAEGLSYIINDDGEQAAVCLVIGPNVAQQVKEDIPLVLAGDGREDIRNSFLYEDVTDGIFVVNLDNPVITDEIWLDVGGGATLKLTGSVTFDGGLYRFGIVKGTEEQGRATVDITELEINGTKELGNKKSDNIIFWREREGIDVLFNEKDKHITYTFGGSGNDELRYKQ